MFDNCTNGARNDNAQTLTSQGIKIMANQNQTNMAEGHALLKQLEAAQEQLTAQRAHARAESERARIRVERFLANHHTALTVLAAAFDELPFGKFSTYVTDLHVLRVDVAEFKLGFAYRPPELVAEDVQANFCGKVLTEEGRRDNESALSSIAASAQKYFESHLTCGHEWPNDSEYALVYNVSTWPMGWDKTSNIEFFADLGALRTKIAGLDDWQLCEDNYVAYQAYRWDLGPEKFEAGQDVSNLAPTQVERDLVAERNRAPIRRGPAAWPFDHSQTE